jgi:hypothetical protein
MKRATKNEERVEEAERRRERSAKPHWRLVRPKGGGCLLAELWKGEKMRCQPMLPDRKKIVHCKRSQMLKKYVRW